MTDLRTELVEAAKSFYTRGWMLGTAGNLSARISKNHFWVTASGRPKGALTRNDFLKVPLGVPLEQRIDEKKPSAETIIHKRLYELDDQIGAIYHVHSVNSNLVTRLFAGKKIRLPQIEMIKGIGFWAEKPEVDIMVTPNHPVVADIAEEMINRLGDFPKVPGFLIRDHGITAWGATPQEARNRCEIWCYLFDWMIGSHRLNLSP